MQVSTTTILNLSLKRKLSPNKTLNQTLSISNSLPSLSSSLTLSFNVAPSFSQPQLLWLMSILIHGYFVLEFLSFGHWLFFGPLSGHLIFRTDLTNLDHFLSLMLDEFGSFSVYDVGRFFRYEEFQFDLFQVSILFDWYGLKFILKLV